jgi:hypothetical protein
MKENSDTTSNVKARFGWLKKLGVAGFLFFLIKGLVWLALFIFGIDAIF